MSLGINGWGRGNTWSDFTRTTDVDQPLNGTFPYYSDGVVGESYGKGDYKATNGRLYKVSASGAGTPLAWYPAPGYRNSGYHGTNSGASVDIGYRGYSYSSSVRGNNGVYLSFGMTNLGPGDGGCRDFAIQLRCLSE